MKKLILLFCFLCYVQNLSAQNCDDYIHKANVDRFTDHVNLSSKELVSKGKFYFDKEVERILQVKAYKNGQNPSFVIKYPMDYKGSQPRVYFLFHDNSKSVLVEGDERIYGISHPFGYSNDATFYFAIENNKIALEDLKTKRLVAIRLSMPIGGEPEREVPVDKQDFFIQVFKCFSQN